jgi:hypothetical protein
LLSLHGRGGAGLLRTILLSLVAAGVASGLACSSRGTGGGEPADAGSPFQPVTPRVYVAKVKNILVGLAPTDAEVQAVASDAAQLGVLVDGWMTLPEYTRKMMRFFELAFQQTQFTATDFHDQVYAPIGIHPSTTPLLLQNIEESFARTMIELTSQGRPLTEAMTTTSLMMTPALKEFYALLDTLDIDNDGAVYDNFRAEFRRVPIVLEASQGPIPIEQSIDPLSPNFMRWYDPDVATANSQIPGCQKDPLSLPPLAITLHYLLLGSIDAQGSMQAGAVCPRYPGSRAAPQLTSSDFGTWAMTTIRLPRAGESRTAFYDLPSLRSGAELVLNTPRVGFFSTPAFFSNWKTNVSNQARVAADQALIVATGTAIENTDTTYAAGTPGLDAVHAGPADCFACHKTLDPTRSIFAATWTWNYHRQLDPAWTSQPGLFAFRGVIAPVHDIADFGTVLATHPLVASAWAQKLCTYVNSSPCDANDPEFLRIVQLFVDSGYSWGALVREMVTSPLTTHAVSTQTFLHQGEVIAVSRRDHLCASLDARLGLTDACDLTSLGQLGQSASPATTTPLIVSGLPSDAYGRGAAAPILPNQPTLFFRAGIENICENLAAEVIDAPAGTPPPAGSRQWSSTQPDTAIADFVATLMALPPSDPRAPASAALLASHFQSALGQPGVTPTQALRSTFVVACMAPSAASIGL